MAFTREGSTEYTLANGETVTLIYEAQYTLVDNGIGAYEYWGARCVDVDINAECEDADIISVDNEAGEDIYHTLSDKEKKDVAQAAFDHASENCPDVDDVKNDYEDGRPDPRDDYPDYD